VLRAKALLAALEEGHEVRIRQIQQDPLGPDDVVPAEWCWWRTSCVKDAVGVRGSLLIWKLLTMPWKPKAGNSSKSCGFPFYNDALSLVSNGAHDLNSLRVRKTLQFGYVGWLKPFNPGLVG